MTSESPVSVFNAAAHAIQRRDWRAVAALCDPVSLIAFKRELLASIAPLHPRPRLTVDDLMRNDPDMPREAAEYHLAQQWKFSDQANRLGNELGVETIEQAEGMSPEDVFVAWLDAHSFERQLERQIAQGLLPPETANLTEPFPEFLPVAFDAVIEESLAYVLYRRVGPDTPGGDSGDADPEWQELRAQLSEDEKQLQLDLANRPSWATCRRQPSGEWRLIATQNFLHMGNGFFFVVHDEVE